MTREEAIGWLKAINTKEFGWDEFALQESQREIRERCEQGVREAIDMAIEALQEPKTIIGIDIPYGSDKGIATLFKGKDDKLILEEVKEIMSVVHCKDCKHQKFYINDNESFHCDQSGVVNMHMEDGDGEFFCKYGERREDE